MLKWKLTNQNFETFSKTKWGEGVTHETSGEGELCGPGWLHYYHHPILAVVMNPVHAEIETPILWEAEAEGDHKDDRGLKGGCTRLTTLRQSPLPFVPLEKRVELAIRCFHGFRPETQEAKWASEWISGRNRSAEACESINIARFGISAAYAAWAAGCLARLSSKSSDRSVVLCSAQSLDWSTCPNILEIVREMFPEYNQD